jgi:rabenosyn-5
MMPRSTSTSSNLTLADKRKSILSIDGALDAMKAKDMWKGLKGVANPPDQVEAARKRGTSISLVRRRRGADNSGRTGNCEMGR